MNSPRMQNSFFHWAGVYEGVDTRMIETTRINLWLIKLGAKMPPPPHTYTHTLSSSSSIWLFPRGSTSPPPHTHTRYLSLLLFLYPSFSECPLRRSLTHSLILSHSLSVSPKTSSTSLTHYLSLSLSLSLSFPPFLSPSFPLILHLSLGKRPPPRSLTHPLSFSHVLC